MNLTAIFQTGGVVDRADKAIDDGWNRIKKQLHFPPANVAIDQLAKWQLAAKFQRAVERIKSPRRLVLTTVAILLSLLWLGQAIMGIMFRSSASTSQLLNWIPLSLATYMIWNFLKAAGQKPIEPFEWTESEREWLFGSPLTRRDLIHYRCSTIARAALSKSLIFSLVMIPDLAVLPLGFLGIFIGLTFIDLVRVLLEIAMYGLKKRELLLFRVTVFGIAFVVAARAIVATAISQDFATNAESAASFGLLLQLLSELTVQAKTWYGYAFLSPFQQISQVIVAEQVSPVVWTRLIVGACILCGLTKAIPLADRFFSDRRNRMERLNFPQAKKRQLEFARQCKSKLKAPSYWGGIGGLAWRQWIGTLGFYRSVAFSLFIPALLSCMPAFADVTGFALVANTVGALAFYSLVLLPASLKFDFRRDIDRIGVLKSLPLSPFQTTVGQLAIPVLLTTFFQLVSLLMVMALSPYHPLLLLGGLAVLLPFNLFVYSFENLTVFVVPTPNRPRRHASLIAFNIGVYCQVSFVCDCICNNVWLGIGFQMDRLFFATESMVNDIKPIRSRHVRPDVYCFGDHVWNPSPRIREFRSFTRFGRNGLTSKRQHPAFPNFLFRQIPHPNFFPNQEFLQRLWMLA